MSHRRSVALLAPLVLALLVGCQSKITRGNFEVIQIDVDTRADVRTILGEPTGNFGDEWMYDDLDRHVSAIIYFHADGRVAGKEWMDAMSNTFEGENPGTADTPPGEIRRHRGVSRTYDD